MVVEREGVAASQPSETSRKMVIISGEQAAADVLMRVVGTLAALLVCLSIGVSVDAWLRVSLSIAGSASTAERSCKLIRCKSGAEDDKKPAAHSPAWGTGRNTSSTAANKATAARTRRDSARPNRLSISAGTRLEWKISGRALQIHFLDSTGMESAGLKLFLRAWSSCERGVLPRNESQHDAPDGMIPHCRFGINLALFRPPEQNRRGGGSAGVLRIKASSPLIMTNKKMHFHRTRRQVDTRVMPRTIAPLLLN